ncbi:uncharacterized protein N7515_009816 [Penicillium bovifimosum]|uniref:Large ribosomal subunit protein mL50 n=1 Tax=Penicillium bovifimosum TaxID=126998 RepID=A0A9W9KUV5_9EURO|nr:uncharacterized protein N7515_009816 [Penicillium bovifimosum]KAJ5120428.1 hypothetical protein N7515_009816 [Penicillium bovifimosum]
MPSIQITKHVTCAFLEFVSPSQPNSAGSTLQTAHAPTLSNAPINAPPIAGGKIPTPRISPLNQVRCYASESPGILERTRRKLWGTDQPPGPADPYSGSQLMPGSEPAPEKQEDEGFSLSKGVEAPENVEVENLTWEGMPKIGYLPEDAWRLKGQNKKTDVVKAWYANENALPLREAVHQAAVEMGLNQILGLPLTSRNEAFRARVIRASIKSCKFEGEAGQWGDRLRFPNNTTMERLLLTAQKSVSPELEEADFQKRIEELKSAGKLENSIYGAETKGHSLKSLPLDDGTVKFAFFSRLSELTGERISDSVITSSNTVGKVFSQQESLRKKTVRLNPVTLHEIMDKNGAAELPNVKIADVRQTRHHIDEDFGRKKLIVSTLYQNGLINKPLGQKISRWKRPKTVAA